MHYLWWILALLLIAGEVLLPGYFMLWIGLAAAAMGVLLWLVPGAGPAGAGGAVRAAGDCRLRGSTRACCARGWNAAQPGSERLNRRAEQMIGQRYVLIEPIVNGRGKARVGDGQWLVSGPDLPLGSTVEVVAVDGTTLQVRAVA